MNNMSNKNILEIKNLKTYFSLDEGLVKSVDGVDLKVRRGQTVGIVGESGCGKSVTARSILRIVPSPGKIIDGEILYYSSKNDGDENSQSTPCDLVGLDPKGKEIRAVRGSEISMIFQEPMTSLSPVHTIGNQIIETIKLHQNLRTEDAKEKAAEIIARVGLAQPRNQLNRYPHELSGGMRQRVMIAMALSCHPRILIADEPTTALDVTTEAQILQLMKSLQKELGMSIIYITHNLGVVAQMTDFVMVMYLGRIVEETDVYSLFANPKHPYTQALLRSIPRLGSARGHSLETISGSIPNPCHKPSGCSFHPRCTKCIDGLCNVKEPPKIRIGPDHYVRCHLYGENN